VQGGEAAGYADEFGTQGFADSGFNENGFR
jgi:hypothetical protein